MKLELKHLAPYLPHSVQIYGGSQISILKGLEYFNQHEFKLIISHPPFDNEMEVSSLEHSLILRPLSDLTKEIEVNGEKFVPIKHPKIIWIHDVMNKHKDAELKAMVEVSPYYCWVKFFEWHFDVFGLIPEGIAIDISQTK